MFLSIGKSTIANWLTNTGGRLALAMLFVLASGALAVSAATINVPADHATIQAAINAAAPGDIIVVAPGTYAEVITVDKRVTIDGAGSGNNPLVDTIIDGSAAGFGSIDAAAITVTGSGADAANRLVIQDLRIVGSQFSSINIGGTANAAVSFLTLSNLVLDGTAAETMGTYAMGVYIRGTGAMTDFVLDQIHASHFFNGAIALNNFGALTSVDGFVLTNSTLTENRMGLHTYTDAASSTNENTFKNVTITDNLISENSWKGMYFEALSNAVLSRNTILHSGFGLGGFNNGNGNTGIELNLKHGNHHDVEISNNVFDNSGIYMGAGTDVSGALAIKPRNIGSYAGNPATLTNVTVKRNVFQNIPVANGKAMLVGEYGTVMPANMLVTKNDFGDGTFPGIKNTTAAGTVDAPVNWWGQSSGAGGAQNTGLVDSVPYISAFVDDPAHTLDTGFFPLMTTVTSIVNDGPDPTTVGQSYTVTGTVQVAGLGGATANDATLAGQVTVSDGTDSCTDMSVTDSGTLNLYNFSCLLTSTTSGAKTLTATYSDTTADKSFNTSSGTAAHNVLPCASVNTPILSSLTTYPSTAGVPVTIPVTTSDMTGRDAISADFTFTYNPAVLDPTPANISVTAGPVLSGTAVLTVNKATAGTIIVSIFDTASFTGAGALVNINMRVIGQIGSSTGLTLSNFRYNGTLICVDPVTSGTLTVISGSISGRVTYENAAVPVVPVPFTDLNAPGTPAVSDTTDFNGDYTLSGFGPGAYTVTPSKADEVFTAPNGIFSDDPALVAQHVVMLITLNATQQRAAKVSGQANISSFDAALIAQWIVGIPNVINQTGKWVFTPVNNTYGPNINSDLTGEDYLGLLMGDVNGDWVAPTIRPAPVAHRPAADDVRASLSSGDAAQGSVVTIPFNISNLMGRSLSSYQFDVQYDPDVLEPMPTAADISGTMIDGASVVSHSPQPGLLKVVVFGAFPASGDGVYANLRFTAIGAEGSFTRLRLLGFRFDNGRTGVTMSNGMLHIRPAELPSIQGRLLTAYGKPVQNTRVLLSDMQGGVRSVLTDAEGRFQFAGLDAGATFEISVRSARYRFVPQTVTVAERGTRVELVAAQ